MRKGRIVIEPDTKWVLPMVMMRAGIRGPQCIGKFLWNMPGWAGSQRRPVKYQSIMNMKFPHALEADRAYNTHRDLTTAVAAPLLLVLLLPEPSAPRHNKVACCFRAIIRLRSTLPDAMIRSSANFTSSGLILWKGVLLFRGFLPFFSLPLPSTPAAPETPAAPVQHQQQAQGINCEVQAKEFTKCLEHADLPSCSWYLEQLKACQAAASQY
ncbi:hypothetical protein NUW54_g7602 [Trametes sanguinea]|uniref:Uncharacterized protein n=1 Tax=Trametes sanguinea TaxID=158606 RepID=A0ACC1PM23_9APHY|nr:hypothetical protein NUW54_g7602 [Trametes sanguinea]